MALVDIKFHEVLPPEILFFVAFCFFCHKNEPGFFFDPRVSPASWCLILTARIRSWGSWTWSRGAMRFSSAWPPPSRAPPDASKFQPWDPCYKLVQAIVASHHERYGFLRLINKRITILSSCVDRAYICRLSSICSKQFSLQVNS